MFSEVQSYSGVEKWISTFSFELLGLAFCIVKDLVFFFTRLKEQERCYVELICMLVSMHCCAANIYKSLKVNAIVFSALWIKWQGN